MSQTLFVVERRRKPRDPKSRLAEKELRAFESFRALEAACSALKQECQELVNQLKGEK
jgi:hypothetical protein